MNPIDSKTLDKLEKYIRGQLTDVEKQSLELRLKSEPELKEWLNWMKDFSKGIEKVTINEKKALVKDWITEDRENAKSKRKKTMYILSFVFILCLIGLAFYFTFLKPNADHSPLERIVNVHLETPYKSPMVLRNAVNDDWQRSIQYYSNRDYVTFLEVNAELIHNGNANNEQKFYLALGSLYKVPPNHHLTEQYLTELLGNHSGYEDLALWYRSLLYLKSSNHSKAKEDLQLLIDRSNFKKDEATELLNFIMK